VISILMAAGAALAVALLGTPVAIHAFSSWGWGQRIREDGPHTHMEKMGTPTMGGIVIVIGLFAGFLAFFLIVFGDNGDDADHGTED